MSQFDRLLQDITKLNRNLRFDDLAKALRRIGYTQNQPKSGSSHYTFRRKTYLPITIPKSNSTIDIVYIRLVREAVSEYLASKENENAENTDASNGGKTDEEHKES